ncbi:Transcription factor bHLH47 [Linum grandiflorum]
MTSDTSGDLVAVDVTVEAAAEKGSCKGKNKAKVPRRVHKAERERLKREQLNDLFIDLATALEMEEANSGKASILNEAARLLKDLRGQIDALKKDNASLLFESRYVTTEKNELKDENSVLETQIGDLQSEVEARLSQLKPDLNIPPSIEFQQPETAAAVLAPHFPRQHILDPSMQQPPAVFMVPFHHDISSLPSVKSNITKPHARYPTAADSWPSKLLGGKEVTVGDNNESMCNPLGIFE